MKIALTGATGGVGKAVALEARRRGLGVRALVRNPDKARELENAGVELIRGDLEARDALEETARGTAAFLHAAAHVGDQGTPEEFERVNVGGTRNAVEAAAAAGVKRFVQVSSSAYYGRPDQGTILEDFPPLPIAEPYERTKQEAERLAFARGKDLGLEVAAVRPPIIYGPHDRVFLPRVVAQLKARRAVYIDGGRAPLNMVNVDDVVDVLLRCADNPAARGEAFNVAAWPPPSVRDVLQTVADATGLPRPFISLPKSVAMGIGRLMDRTFKLVGATSPPPLTPFVVTILTRYVVYDASKARRLLGWAGGERPLDDLRVLAAAHVAKG